MRESKFRGKRIDNDKWVYGDLIHCYGADAGRIFIKTFTGLYEVDPTTVGEYIGHLPVGTCLLPVSENRLYIRRVSLCIYTVECIFSIVFSEICVYFYINMGGVFI